MPPCLMPFSSKRFYGNGTKEINTQYIGHRAEWIVLCSVLLFCPSITLSAVSAFFVSCNADIGMARLRSVSQLVNLVDEHDI